MLQQAEIDLAAPLGALQQLEEGVLGHAPQVGPGTGVAKAVDRFAEHREKGLLREVVRFLGVTAEETEVAPDCRLVIANQPFQGRGADRGCTRGSRHLLGNPQSARAGAGYSTFFPAAAPSSVRAWHMSGR